MAVRSKRSGDRGADRVRGSIHTIPQTAIIPHDIYSPVTKVEVDTDAEGTINLNSYNSEEYAFHISTTSKTLNRGLGMAKILVANPNGIWNEKITGGEAIRVYGDYGSATNQLWEGKIDSVLKNLDQKNGYHIVLVCRQRPEIQDKKVCMTYNNDSGTVAIQSLVDEWFSTTLTYTNLSTISTIFNRDYVWKSGHKILRDIFNKSTTVGYIDFDGDINSFSEQKNNIEKISIANNCTTVDGYGADLQKRKNNIILVGDRVESSQTLFYTWSKKDSGNISDFWQKDLVMSDSSISSQDSAETDSELLYNDENRDFIEGSLNAFGGLPTLRPGESILCSVPLCAIDGWFQIHEFTHTISPNGWITRVFYSKKLKAQQSLFDNRDDLIDGNRLASKNPFGMTNAYVVLFEESPTLVESFTATEENNSGLQLTTGNSTGNATSFSKLMDDDITSVELRVHGQDLNGGRYEISVDDGASYESLALNTKHTVISTATNKKRLKVRWYLVEDTDNPDPKIFSSWCGVRFD